MEYITSRGFEIPKAATKFEADLRFHLWRNFWTPCATATRIEQSFSGSWKGDRQDSLPADAVPAGRPGIVPRPGPAGHRGPRADVTPEETRR